MMFALVALIWFGTSYLAYRIGFRSAVDASASLVVKLLTVIKLQEDEIAASKPD